jgi:cation/acetate symporter
MKSLLLAMMLGATICPSFGVDTASTALAAPSPAIESRSPGAQAPAQAGQVAVQTNIPASPAKSGTASSPGAQAKPNKMVSVGMFLAVIAVTMLIVVWAAKKTKTASDFYAAGGGISGMQNGWAIAGDLLSAATFLGITGLVTIFGFDGAIYAVGPLISFITILLIIAEPLRNVGKFTMGDILALRGSSNQVRAGAAISTVAVSMFYLLAQMVGAGKLMQLLLDIPYKVSVIGIGMLITVYVVFGGMKATTWVQIIKALLLVASGIVLSVAVLIKAGVSPVGFFDSVAMSSAVQDHVRMLLKHPLPQAGFDYGQRFLEPGLFLKDPLDLISLGLGTIFGGAGLPHIMMRFFTVPDARAARKSVIVSMFIIGLFLLLTSILGMGAALHVTPQKVMMSDKGGNMAALLLAQQFGGGAGTLGGDLSFAFLCAVAFSTILAVVSGLVLACSAAIAHDIYVNVIKGGKSDQRQQVTVARTTSLAVGFVATWMAVAAENTNVAHLVVLAFAVAASGNFPVLILSLFWKKFNTAGILSGLTIGMVVCVGLVLVSPNMTYPKKIAADARKIVDVLEKKQAQGIVLAEKDLKSLEKARGDYAKNKDGKSLLGLDAPLFPLKNPAIVSVPIGFLAAVMGCLLFRRDRRAEDLFEELYVRQNTGLGITQASEH